MTTGASHDGETLKQAWRRLWLDVRYFWRRHPEARNRYGWQDLLAGHAITNLYVTYAREDPRDAGHAWRYSVLALLGVIALMGIALWWVL